MAEAHKDSERITSFKSGAESVDASEEQRVLLTINARGKIVRVEKVQTSGANEELGKEELAKLVGDDEVEEIEAGLEEAFEMGVAAVMGEEYAEDESQDEDDEERALRRLLIGGLLRRPVQQRILQRLLVSRLLRRRALKRRKPS